MFDYSPLWETMQRRGVSQYQLLKSGVDNKTLDALKKGRNITMVTLEKLSSAAPPMTSSASPMSPADGVIF